MTSNFIEEKTREFDDQFVPIDWLLFSAKERPSSDRGSDVGVAKYHADRIKLWLKEILTDALVEGGRIREGEILAALPALLHESITARDLFDHLRTLITQRKEV